MRSGEHPAGARRGSHGPAATSLTDARLVSLSGTEDGVIHMQLRTNSELLWQTKSADDGATWSPPHATGFSDNATKFHYGRLPDGRFYYVRCPDPEPLW